MLKRNITYEDFNGIEHTDTFYFNISKPELIELEVEFEGGFQAMMQRVIEAKDQRALIYEFKRIVLLAYGEKSDDGKRFIKNEKMREEFEQHAAYAILYMELATEEDAAVEFLQGVLPKDLVDGTDAELQIPDKPTEPPKVPSSNA